MLAGVVGDVAYDAVQAPGQPFRVLRLRSRDLPEGAGHRGEFVKVAEAFLRGCGLPQTIPSAIPR